MIEGVTARRPDWRLEVFATVSHLLPPEIPDAYADAVGRWVAGSDRASDDDGIPSPREP